MVSPSQLAQLQWISGLKDVISPLQRGRNRGIFTQLPSWCLMNTVMNCALCSVVLLPLVIKLSYLRASCFTVWITFLLVPFDYEVFFRCLVIGATFYIMCQTFACSELQLQTAIKHLSFVVWLQGWELFGRLTLAGWQQILQWWYFHLLVPSYFFPCLSLFMWLFYLCLYYWKITHQSRQTSETALCKHNKLLMRCLRNFDIYTVFYWDEIGGKYNNKAMFFNTHLEYLKGFVCLGLVKNINMNKVSK